MNDVVVPWCRKQKIEVTRSRAYKKNDQAFVEQKNGAVVRRLVGYGRFEGIDTARLLVRLYAASRLHTNFFQPSFKLKEKRREAWLQTVLHLYDDRVLPFDTSTAEIAGALADLARSRGHSPGFADMAIAATASRHSLTILSRNKRHFTPMDVALIDPFHKLPADKRSSHDD